MIVLGSRGAGGFTGVMLGSTAGRVARHAPCLVLIIPPETVADRERLGWVVRA
jgi:nucleotide-binding universal stress UspA family protein